MDTWKVKVTEENKDILTEWKRAVSGGFLDEPAEVGHYVDFQGSNCTVFDSADPISFGEFMEQHYYRVMKPDTDEFLDRSEQSKQNAIARLKSLDQDTVIDDNWYEYFIWDTTTLLALLIATDSKTYADVLHDYEGWTIDGLLHRISFSIGDEVYARINDIDLGTEAWTKGVIQDIQPKANFSYKVNGEWVFHVQRETPYPEDIKEEGDE